MTPCTNCPSFQCQRRDGPNIPRACITRNSAQSKPTINQFAYMGKQEAKLRASMIDGTWDGGGGSY
jgi:hypothetical protein